MKDRNRKMSRKHRPQFTKTTVQPGAKPILVFPIKQEQGCEWGQRSPRDKLRMCKQSLPSMASSYVWPQPYSQCWSDSSLHILRDQLTLLASLASQSGYLLFRLCSSPNTPSHLTMLFEGRDQEPSLGEGLRLFTVNPEIHLKGENRR